METESEKLSVFVSYSRDDLEFADQLDEGLQLTGFATVIDRHGISGGENWESRLGSLIRDADTVVFVLSPSSAGSEICTWEVAEAARLNKRIIPVLCRPLSDHEPPPQLSQLNYIYFYAEPKSPGSGFGNGLRKLVYALRTDLDWLREHTRLLQRASEWVSGGKVPSRLLSGRDIEAAKDWIANRPKGAPTPTELHLEFIRASEDEENSRASAEHQRLAQIETAQKERAAALQEREAATRKLSRRTSFALAGATGLVGLASGLAYWGVNAERRYRAEQERVALAKEEAKEEEISKEASRTDINGSLLMYATQRGAVSEDSDIFPRSLANALRDRNVSVEQAVRKARDEVIAFTGGRQRPYVSTDMSGDIYLQRQSAERKLFSITIGNDTYQTELGLLANSRKGAKSWSDFNRSARFEETLLLDATLAQMRLALEAIAKQIDLPIVPPSPDGSEERQFRGLARGLAPVAQSHNILVMFFFSGHAVMINGQLVLAPVDAKGIKPEELLQSCVLAADVEKALIRPGIASILIFDCCSNELQQNASTAER